MQGDFNQLLSKYVQGCQYYLPQMQMANLSPSMLSSQNSPNSPMMMNYQGNNALSMAPTKTMMVRSPPALNIPGPIYPQNPFSMPNQSVPYQMVNSGNVGTLQRAKCPTEEQPTAPADNKEDIEKKLIRRAKLEEELVAMLKFLVKNVGIMQPQQLFEHKKKYAEILREDEVAVFDQVVNKQLFSKKTKEEMIKQILRKCFKFLKSHIRNREFIPQKDLDKAFQMKYFSPLQSNNSKKRKLQQSPSFDSDSDTLDEMMPFRKNSQIKTMNSQFLRRIFKSTLFQQDYQLYLDNFDEIAEKENDKKIRKFAVHIVELIDRKKIEKVKTQKRLPWLTSWMSDTKELANKLMYYSSANANINWEDSILDKKVKCEPSSVKTIDISNEHVKSESANERTACGSDDEQPTESHSDR